MISKRLDDIAGILVVFIVSGSIMALCLSGIIHETSWDVPNTQDIKSINGIFSRGQKIVYGDGKEIILRCLPFNVRLGVNCLPGLDLEGQYVHATYFTPHDSNFGENEGIVLSLSTQNSTIMDQVDRLQYFSKLKGGSSRNYDAARIIFSIIFAPFFILSSIALYVKLIKQRR